MRISFPNTAARRGGLVAWFALGASSMLAAPLADGTHSSRSLDGQRDEGVPSPSRALPADRLAYPKLHALPFGDLKTTLERAGWPASHVRAFVEAEIQTRLNPPQPPRADELQPFEFWRTGPDAEALPPATLRHREKERERRETAVRVASDALFPPTEEPAGGAVPAWNDHREWGDLSFEKRAQVTAATAEASRARDAILQPRGGQLTPREWDSVRQISVQLRATLAQILPPDELLDYDLRTSPTANQLRRELDAFAPTRDEFLAIFRLRQAYDLRFGAVSRGAWPALEAERRAADAELEHALLAALGETRFADYRLSLEPGCQTLMFDGRFAGVDAVNVRRLYRATLAVREHRGSPDAPVAKAALFREFRAVFDEEATRRFLREQELWP